MGILMGAMAIIMVVALMGWGRHGSMMSGHGKETQKEETVERGHGKDAPCPECPSKEIE